MFRPANTSRLLFFLFLEPWALFSARVIPLIVVRCPGLFVYAFFLFISPFCISSGSFRFITSVFDEG